MTDDRAAFEAWARKGYKLSPGYVFQREGEGYLVENIDDHWEGWQARETEIEALREQITAAQEREQTNRLARHNEVETLRERVNELERDAVILKAVSAEYNACIRYMHTEGADFVEFQTSPSLRAAIIKGGSVSFNNPDGNTIERQTMTTVLNPDAIEANVPIPRPRIRTGYLVTARAMKVGDSIRFEELNQAQSFRREIYNLGRKAAIRKTEGAYRVWMVEGETKANRK